MDAESDRRVEPLEVEGLTWAALLGQCVVLAQAALALPVGEDEAGREAQAWRASVAHVIALQAVWFAMERSGGLCESERKLGRDRAAVALGEHEAKLEAIWGEVGGGGGVGGGGMPDSVFSLIGDVRRQVEG